MTYHELFLLYVHGTSRPSEKGQITGKCPFHDDSTSSWSGNIESGAWHCFACQAKGSGKEFAARFGQTITADPVPPPKPRASESNRAQEVWERKDPESTYDYTDSSGEKLLYQIGRFVGQDGKKFFLPRVPLREGAWRYALEDATRVLYRLPEIHAARQVFYCEGEKCVEALRKIGKVATTHAGGVNGTLSPAMLAPLRGKHVVILPDNDEPGKQLGERLQKMLDKIAAIVSIIDLPGLGPKGDIADWLTAGHTAHDLLAQVADAPIVGGLNPFIPSLQRFSTITKKDIHWLWYPYIPLGRVTMLEGNPGVGKSWFCAAMAGAVSLGKMPFLINGGRSLITPAGSIYMNLEDDPEDTTKVRLDAVEANQERIATLSGKQGADGKVLPITIADLDIFARSIEDMKAKLLMIDPIQAYLPSGKEMNKAEHIRPLMQELQRLAKEYECAVVLVRHLAKGNGKDNVLYRGMGSIDFTAAARSVLQFVDTIPDGEKAQEGVTRVGVIQVKNNLAPKGPVLEFEKRLNAFSWVRIVEMADPSSLAHLSPANSQEVKDAQLLIHHILKDGPCSAKAIREQAKDAGVPAAALNMAKAMLRIEVDFHNNDWAWVLPHEATKYYH